MILKIKDEFKKLIPALSQEEYDQLEQNCVNEGIRDAICVWDGYIIDGHNRYEIALKHGMEYDVEEMQFDSDEDVIIWMCENQLGRRNLEPIDKQPLMERIEEIEADKAKERMYKGNNQYSPVENLPQVQNEQKTRDKVAEKMGVSGKTYDALKKVNKEGTDDLKDQVRQKKVGASTAAVITELPKEEQDEVVAKGTKEILEMAKELKQKRKDAYKEKMEKRINDKAKMPISFEESEILEKAKNGETVVINMNKHFTVLKWAKDNDKYQQIDRYSEWGNPFYLDIDGDRDHVCDAYARYYNDKKSLHSKINNLKGKVLGCHCAPLRCHGDELKKILNNKNN